jgi:hypothetical protein
VASVRPIAPKNLIIEGQRATHHRNRSVGSGQRSHVDVEIVQVARSPVHNIRIAAGQIAVEAGCYRAGAESRRTGEIVNCVEQQRAVAGFDDAANASTASRTTAMAQKQISMTIMSPMKKAAAGLLWLG